MNKIAFISDIHGNMPALKAVLDDIEKKDVSRIYCLGDLVGYYCFFNEVVDKIRSLNIPTVIGNHDHALVYNSGVIEHSKTCTNILHWQLENAKPETLSFLKSLPTSLNINFGGREIMMVHAGLQDHVDEYLFDVSDAYMKEHNFNSDVLVSGHTHLISYKKLYSGKAWFNPGSVGQPRDLNPKASYLVLDEDLNPEFVRVAYDYEVVIKAMKENGFDDYISGGLKTGKKIQ
jgi:putative phosphoesterase